MLRLGLGSLDPWLHMPQGGQKRKKIKTTIHSVPSPMGVPPPLTQSRQENQPELDLEEMKGNDSFFNKIKLKKTKTEEFPS